MPPAPVKATTVSDWFMPVDTDCVAVTVALINRAGARADQISEVPEMVLARLTRVHVSPAPDTVRRLAPTKGTLGGDERHEQLARRGRGQCDGLCPCAVRKDDPVDREHSRRAG